MLSETDGTCCERSESNLNDWVNDSSELHHKQSVSQSKRNASKKEIWKSKNEGNQYYDEDNISFSNKFDISCRQNVEYSDYDKNYNKTQRWQSTSFVELAKLYDSVFIFDSEGFEVNTHSPWIPHSKYLNKISSQKFSGIPLIKHLNLHDFDKFQN